MDIQNIRAFLMVSETGSFSRAAEKLHLSQPAVTKRIQSLEQSLAIALFDRIGKSVQLTEAGRTLIPGCRRILNELEENLRRVSNLRDRPLGKLSLATSHHIGLHRLPPVLRQYAQDYPGVELDIHFMDSETACQRLIKGDIELAIITLPELNDSGLLMQPIWTDTLHCVISAHHGQANKITTLQQLIKLPAILPSPGTTTRNLIDRTLGLDEHTPLLLETSYLETIKAMIETGLGWGVLPASMLDKSLKPIKLKNINMYRELGAVTLKARTCSSPANAMLQALGVNQEVN